MYIVDNNDIYLLTETIDTIQDSARQIDGKISPPFPASRDQGQALLSGLVFARLGFGGRWRRSGHGVDERSGTQYAVPGRDVSQRLVYSPAQPASPPVHDGRQRLLFPSPTISL